MNPVAFQGRGPQNLQGRVRKPSAFDSSQQARGRKPRRVFSIGDLDLALHNKSFEPTLSGSRRLAAPGQVIHRPSAASRRLPTRSAQLERYASGFGQHREHHLAGLRSRHPRNARPEVVVIECSVAARPGRFSGSETQ